MSSADKNLSLVAAPTLPEPEKVSIGIVTSAWNTEITSALREGAFKHLREAGIPEQNIIEVIVPGSFELPLGAKFLLTGHKLDAVLCLGCVIKGETDHDKYINQATANGMMQLSLLSSKPCVFGLLTVNNKQQALDRAGGKHGNKGIEAAATALAMIAIKTSSIDKKQIGF